MAYERGTEELLDAVENLQPEQMDPSLVNGYYIFYEREVPFELRVSEAADMPQEVGALEAIRVKILLKGDQQQPDALRIPKLRPHGQP